MEPLLAEFAAAAEASGFSRWARGSATIYPLANLAHLLGLVLLVGGIGLVDLRVAGAFRALPLAALSRALTPLAVAGLFIMAGSGAIMFASDANALAESPVFQWKLGLVALALFNAAVFRLDLASKPAWLAHASALLSLGLWLAVATLGRLIAYT